MPIVFSKLSILSATTALCLIASTASSATVELTFHGLTSSRNVTITDAPVDGPNGSTWPQTFPAGGFNMQDHTNTIGDSLGKFIAWCLDIGSYLSTSSSNKKDYDITSEPFSNSVLLDDPAIGRLQSVFDANYTTLDTSDGDKSAGFQLALWDAIYDSDFSISLSTGQFRATSSSPDAVSFANSFLAEAEGYTGAKLFNLTFLQSNNGDNVRNQNLVTPSSVPIPATGGLFLFALGGIAVASRRSKKT